MKSCSPLKTFRVALLPELELRLHHGGNSLTLLRAPWKVCALSLIVKIVVDVISWELCFQLNYQVHRWLCKECQNAGLGFETL